MKRITLCLAMLFSFQAFGTVGAALTFFTHHPAALDIGLSGLATAYSAKLLRDQHPPRDSEEAFFYYGLIVLGFVMLDDDQIRLDLSKAKTFDHLSLEESKAVSLYQEELESLFERACQDRHPDLAAARFQEAKNIFGEHAINGLYKILNHY